MATKTGYIGIGLIGKEIAANAVKGGFDVMVYDLREAPMKAMAALGARMGGSPKEVGAHAEIVEISVVDDAQVEEVTIGENGILSGAKPGTIMVIHSTIHPKTVRKVGERAKTKGVGVVDAQVTGGARGARARTLTYMVGGEKGLLETCRSLFAVSASQIFHVGELGMGATTKLAQQSILMMTRLAAYEGMLLAEKAGLDLKILQQVVHASGAQSSVVDNWLEQYKSLAIQTGATGPAAAQQQLDGFYKGLCPALELGHELGLSLPGLALTQQLLDRILGMER
jgi:2-hydroxy-3-oxopropionate reductase